jgi:tripartite-type tricarboxylate transporter receptor subunit TctC
MRALAALLIALFVAQTPAAAQNWPSQTVRMIVPFPAGGPADIIARYVAERLSQSWGQGVIIENKPGANTAIAAAQVAKAPADGYTLFVVMDVTMVLNPITMKSISYDPRRDFVPITMLSKNTSLLTVHADGPKTMAELIAKGRANPGKLNFGAGIITTRLAGELFNRETGMSVQYVPFQGSPPTVQALLSKSVDFIVDGQAASLPLIQNGTFRALAKTNNGPVLALPNLKTMAQEANSSELEDISTWIGLVAPTGTPQSVVDKVQGAIAKIFAEPGVKERLLNMGINATSSTPAVFNDFMNRETARWSKVVKEINIELN